MPANRKPADPSLAVAVAEKRITDALRSQEDRILAALNRRVMPEILGVDDIAKLTGLNPNTIHRMHRAGRLPECMPGITTKRWSGDSIRSWVASWGDSPPAAGRPGARGGGKR